MGKKNLKLNVLLVLKLKNNVVNFLENLKNFQKDLKKLVVLLLLKLNFPKDVKLKWPNLDVILKNLILPMNLLSQVFVRNKLIKLVNFLKALITSNALNKN